MVLSEKRSRQFALFIGIAICLVVFRFILAAPFGLALKTRAFLPLPVFALLLIILKNSRLEPLKLSLRRLRPIEKITFGFLTLSTAYWCSVWITVPEDFRIHFVKSFSTQFVLIFPLLLLRTGIHFSDLYKILKMIAYLVIWVSSVFFIVAPFFMHANDIANILLPLGDQLSLGGAYVLRLMRRCGFLINLESSACILVGATTLLVFEVFQKKSREVLRARFLILSAVVGLIATLLSTSFTAIAGTGLLFLVAYWWSDDQRKVKLSRFGIIAGGMILFFIGVSQLPTGKQLIGRVIEYSENPAVLLRAYQPDFNCRSSSLIWNLDPSFSVEKSCSFGELHVLSSVATYGIIPNLGWLTWLFFPVLLIPRAKRLEVQARGALLFCLSFVFCAVHYSGAEAWGNNYTFLLALTAVLIASPDTTDKIGSISE